MSDPVAVLTEADWPGLDDWLKKYPFPDGKDDDVNMTELAGVFGVSTNTVKTWLTQTEDRMPYVVRGGNGREYVLKLSWCFAWRKQNEAQKSSRQQNLMQLQGQLFGVEQDDPEQALSMKQVREVAEAKMKHAAAARMLGTLTEIQDVYEMMAKVFVEMRNSAMGMSDRLERELSLTPPQARQVNRAMEEMLSALIEVLNENVIGKDFTPNLEMSAQLVNET